MFINWQLNNDCVIFASVTGFYMNRFVMVNGTSAINMKHTKLDLQLKLLQMTPPQLLLCRCMSAKCKFDMRKVLQTYWSMYDFWASFLEFIFPFCLALFFFWSSNTNWFHTKFCGDHFSFAILLRIFPVYPEVLLQDQPKSQANIKIKSIHRMNQMPWTKFFLKKNYGLWFFPQVKKPAKISIAYRWTKFV